VKDADRRKRVASESCYPFTRASSDTTAREGDHFIHADLRAGRKGHMTSSTRGVRNYMQERKQEALTPGSGRYARSGAKWRFANARPEPDFK